MMPNYTILATNHTSFTVADLEAPVAFFRDVLGFEISEPVIHRSAMVGRLTGVKGAEIAIVFVETPGHYIELIQYFEPTERHSSALRPCDPGFAHIAFQVDDIDAVTAASAAAGFTPLGPPQLVEAGPRKGGKNVYVRNTDSIVIEFQQAPP